MDWRREQLKPFGEQIAWLSESESADIYAAASEFNSDSHYGLNPKGIEAIEALDAGIEGVDVHGWLSQRIGFDDLLVVFDQKNVCRMSGRFFLQNWQDIFCPSRDDAIILCGGSGVLFYCHEDTFEFGRRRTT